MRIGVSLVAILCLTAGNPAAQAEKTSQGLALDIPLSAEPRPWLVGSICLARSARLGPLCGPATSTQSAFGAALRSNVDIQAPNGALLKGTYHSPGQAGPAILLLHQCNMDRRAWDVLTGDLTSTGFHVLTFDLPGFGETKAGGFQVAFISEAEAAYAFLLSQTGVDKNRIAVGGASCGVDLAGDLALRHSEIRALMLMSGYVTGPAMSNIAAKPSIAVFGIVAENDPEGAAGIKDAVRASRNPLSTLKVYPGSEHGVPLFAVHPDLKPTLLEWLRSELR